MRLPVMVLAALVAICPNTQAATYNFEEPTYSFRETRDADNVVPSTDVEITKTGTAAELATASEITITNMCPPGVAATATFSNDYTLVLSATFEQTVTFPAGSLKQGVTLTIKQDSIQESEELFCLTITTDPGTTQPSAVFIIPANDYCQSVPSVGVSSYDISTPGDAFFVMPWNTNEMLDIDITPSDGAGDAGDDVCIHLTNLIDIGHTDFRYYGIFLDDSALGTTHHTTGGVYANGNSGILDNSIAGAGGVSEYIGDLLTPGQTFKLWISYDQNTGLLQYGETSDRVNSLGSAALGVGSRYDIRYVWVSTCAGTAETTTFLLCQDIDPLVQLDIPMSAVSSNGDELEGVPSNAVDGETNPDFTIGSCFLSADIVKPWFRADLGKEYDVIYVNLYGVDTNSALDLSGDDLMGARVSVGSCGPTSTGYVDSNNHVCATLGDFTQGPSTPWEAECASGSIGRYVYVSQEGATATQFSICEIFVYGKEVTYDSVARTTVQFTESVYLIDEDTDPIETTMATRTGTRATCTTVEYFTTDRTAKGGSSTDPTRDYNALVMNANVPKTLEWTVATSTPVSKNVDDVVIHDDNDCEDPETFSIQLANIQGGYLGQRRETIVTITDDDSMTFSLSPPTSPISEGSTPLSITVNRAGPGLMQVASAELRFAGGTATSDDYDDNDQTLQFSSSDSADSQTATVAIIDDACYEGNKGFTVSLGSLSPETCSNTAVPISADVIIEENDSQFYWEIGTVSIKEGDPPVTVNIRRMGDEQDKDVEYNIVPGVGITEQELLQEVAITPSDGVSFGSSVSSRQVTIAVTDDYSVESTESFTLELEDPNGDDCPGGNLGATPRLVVQISDNDAEYEWKDTSFLVTEGAGSARVCLRRTGDTTTNQAVDIAYSTTSSARSGFDFTPLTRISFSGTPEACMDVPIISDGTPEGTETFTLTIDPANSVQIGSDNVLTVTITDDDAIISWVESTYTVPENRNVAVAIEKEGNVAVSVRVSTIAGTATPGLDFIPVSRVITIPASQSTYEFEIDIVDDDEDDNDETFSLTLSSVGSSLGTVTIVSPAVTTVRITDDDPTPTVPPVDDDGLSGGVIAGIVVAVVIGVLVIIGAIVFLLCMAGSGAGAGAAAAGAAGAVGVGGAAGAYGGQQGMPLANYGYPDASAYGLQNFSFGNGYGNNTGFNNFGGNRQFGY